MTRDRRGFTLVELIVVAVLGTLVLGAVLQVLVVNQRTYTANTATISGQQSTRMALDVLFNELREVSAPGGDIVAMARDSLRVRLMRKFGVVCGLNLGGGNPELTVIKIGSVFGVQLGTNLFDVGDSVFVFADNYENDDDDDVWIEARVTDVDTSSVVCPVDGTTIAVDLRFNGQSSLFNADTVGIGAPIRSFDTYTFGTTTFDGDTYLGRRQGTGDMIPIVGPLRANRGLEFIYRDANGAVTSTATDVAQIEVIVRTGSTVLNSLGEMVSDSINAWIHTRN